MLGRFGSEAFGLCDTEVDANGSVGYPLPARFNASVVVEPMERLRLEAMGGWVNWGKFQDFEIEVKDVGQLNDLSEDAAALLNQERSWARDNRDSYWLGVDGKMKLNKVFGVGARLLYDRAAVPDTTLSPSNYDANTVILGGLVMVRPAPHFRVGVGFSQYFVQQRTTDSSAFGMTLNVDERKEDRYAYPAMNGTYSSSISRISLAVRGHFGKGWEDEHD